MMGDQIAITPMTRLLVDIPTAAELLSLNIEAVESLIDEGTLMIVRIGGVIRISYAGLCSWIDELVLTQTTGAESLGEAYGMIAAIANEKRVALEPAETDMVDEVSSPVAPVELAEAEPADVFISGQYL